MCYNVLFTSLPILMYGLLERNRRCEILSNHPQLYRMNKNNYLLSFFRFALWNALGQYPLNEDFVLLV